MGARKCAVPGCQSCTTKPEDKKLTFHRFPVHFKDTWIKVLKLPTNFQTTKNTHICSRHFEKSDFQAFKGKKYFLKHGAIPKIHHVSTLEDLKQEVKSEETKADEIKMETDVIPSTSAEEGKREEKKVTVEPETPKQEVKKEEPVIVEEKKDEIVAVPVLPIFSPKKKRSSVMKRYSDTAISQPSKKVSRKSLSPSASSAKKQKNSKTATPVKSEPSETKPICNPSPKKKNAVISFVPGNTLEAQDFDGKWNSAKVIEVDTEEREVLVRFERSAKSKPTGMNEEWIPMDSSRLRAAQPLVTFEVGEKCLARWSDSRKFPATIQKVLENEAYEVVFDDGYIKVVRGVHIFKVPKSAKDKNESNIQPLLSLPVQGLIPDYVRNVPIPEVKNDGEWCCAWVDDIPIGEESSFDGPFGKVSSIIVPDSRVKEGWQKHVYLRPSGKWDVVFISPMGKKIRFKSELKAHLDEVGEPYDPEKYDFSLHKKRSKALGLYIYSDKLKKESINMFDSKQNLNANLTQSTINHLASLGALPTLPSTVAMSIIPAPRESEIHIGSLKIKVLDKLYLCPQETCDKTFRRQSVLQMHIKHYHPEIFKMTGVCPNMTDLAYLRTTGDEVEVTIPKPKPAPSVTPKRTSTATSSTSNKIKVEQQEVDQKVAEIKNELKREGLLGNMPIQFKESHKSAKNTQRSPILEEALKAPPLIPPIKDEITIEKEVIQTVQRPILTDMIDPGSLITSHSVSKSGVVKTTHGSAFKKRSKIRFGNKPKKISKKRRYELRKQPYQKLKVYKEPKVKKEPGVSGLVQSKMEPTSEVGFYPLSRKKKKMPKGLIPYQSNAGYYNSGENTWSKAYDRQGSYIDENGEVIKIVRMRKEEIINCVCGFVEEDGLMIQCELCLCWQHGGCNFIYKENQVPEKYVCVICKNPTKARTSQKYSHDQDWLFEGKLPIANYHMPNPKQTQRFENLKQCHTLIGNMVEMKRFMHSLDVKINIAEKRGHPKMYLWSKKWESSPPRQAQGNEIDSKKNIKKELKFEEESEPKFVAPSAPEPEAAIDPAKCQKILLGHIQEQQSIVRNRLDDIEKQICDLEAAEDVKYDHKSADSDAKMKQTIFMLLNDLTKMRKVASIHSIPGV